MCTGPACAGLPIVARAGPKGAVHASVRGAEARRQGGAEVHPALRRRGAGRTAGRPGVENGGHGFDLDELVRVAEHGDAHQGARHVVLAERVPDHPQADTRSSCRADATRTRVLMTSSTEAPASASAVRRFSTASPPGPRSPPRPRCCRARRADTNRRGRSAATPRVRWPHRRIRPRRRGSGSGSVKRRWCGSRWVRLLVLVLVLGLGRVPGGSGGRAGWQGRVAWPGVLRCVGRPRNAPSFQRTSRSASLFSTGPLLGHYPAIAPLRAASWVPLRASDPVALPRRRKSEARRTGAPLR